MSFHGYAVSTNQDELVSEPPPLKEILDPPRVFLHVLQLCTENGVSFHIRSAVEVAWLAKNIRHGSTRV